MSTPRVKRVNRGKGHSYTIDGSSVSGVTTIIGDGCPRPALIGWAANTVAGYAVDHWSELEQLTPSKRLRELERSRWATQDAAAARGTQVHDYAAQLSQGADVDVPDEVLPLVDSYLAFVAQYQVQELAVEAVVARYPRSSDGSDAYCGTLDLLATLDGAPGLWLLDYKTGKGVYPEVALQLAAYAHADALIVDGVEHPMPAIERAGVVWLRPDGFELYPCDISERTFLTFQYVQQVALFRNRDRSAYISDALAPRELDGQGVTQ